MWPVAISSSAKLVKNLRSARALVSDNLVTCTLLQLLDQLLRKSMLRKGLERLL